MTTKEEPKQEISEEAKQRAKNYMSLKGALEPKIKCYCGHTTYCDCSPIETTPNKTNMTQQTAVEWLAEQIRNYKTPLNMAGVEFILIHKHMINKFEQQAKEMEKQQIIDAYENGENRSAELYYNETFKQQ